MSGFRPIYVLKPKELRSMTALTVDQYAAFADILAQVAADKETPKFLAMSHYLMKQMTKCKKDMGGLLNSMEGFILVCAGTAAKQMDCRSLPYDDKYCKKLRFARTIIHKSFETVRMRNFIEDTNHLSLNVDLHMQCLRELKMAKKMYTESVTALKEAKAALVFKHKLLNNLKEPDSEEHATLQLEIDAIADRVGTLVKSVAKNKEVFREAIGRETEIRLTLRRINDNTYKVAKSNIVDTLKYACDCMRKIIETIVPLDMQSSFIEEYISPLHPHDIADNLLCLCSHKYILPKTKSFVPDKTGEKEFVVKHKFIPETYLNTEREITVVCGMEKRFPPKGTDIVIIKNRRRNLDAVPNEFLQLGKGQVVHKTSMSTGALAFGWVKKGFLSTKTWGFFWK